LGDAPTRRLFFALWPDEEQRAALAHAAARVVRHCVGRPVPPENLHVTLAFLGSVPELRMEELNAIGRRAAANYPGDALPMTVSLETLEHWAGAQVLVVLGRRDEAQAAAPGAVALARDLVASAAAAGFSPDLKPFRAHVTVARKVARPPRSNETRKVEWSFDEFALIESRTLETGPVYSVVESYVLGSAEKVRT
jgi:2'-5' RNA ligase